MSDDLREVIYLDPAFPELRQFIRDRAGAGFAVRFADEGADLRRAEFFLVAAAKVTAGMIDAAPRLRLIQKTGAGTDNIDLDAARARGVEVLATPGANAGAVAELTIGLILSLYRKIPLLDRRCRAGRWEMWAHRLSSHELSGKVHGVVGFGAIGRRVAELSRAFGAETIHHDPATEDSLPLPRLLARADLVSLHLPLTASTAGLIGRAEIALMRPGAVLVNMARGGIVDEIALYEALSTGSLAAAAADTLAGEPNVSNNPLLTLDNFVCTPHVGAGTRDTLARVLDISFENMRRASDRK